MGDGCWGQADVGQAVQRSGQLEQTRGQVEHQGRALRLQAVQELEQAQLQGARGPREGISRRPQRLTGHPLPFCRNHLGGTAEY